MHANRGVGPRERRYLLADVPPLEHVHHGLVDPGAQRLPLGDQRAVRPGRRARPVECPMQRALIACREATHVLGPVVARPPELVRVHRTAQRRLHLNAPTLDGLAVGRDVRRRIPQDLGALAAPVPLGDRGGGHATVRPGVDAPRWVGARVEQFADDGSRAVLGRLHQRGAALVICVLHVGTELEQRLHTGKRVPCIRVCRHDHGRATFGEHGHAARQALGSRQSRVRSARGQGEVSVRPGCCCNARFIAAKFSADSLCSW